MAAGPASTSAPSPTVPRSTDLRLVPSAVAGWVGAGVGTAAAPVAEEPDLLAGLRWPASGALVLTCALVATAVVGARRGAATRQVALLAVMACLVGLGALLAGQGRVAALAAGPVVQAAADRALVDVRLAIGGDPLPLARPEGAPAWMAERVRVQAVVRTITRVRDARSPPVGVDTPVLVLAPATWAGLRPGDEVVTQGRLRLPDRPRSTAALLDVSHAPEVVAHRAVPLGWGERPRQALREAVGGLSPEPAGLLPSLVVGDESLLADRTREQLRVTGLAHLTAVSGANVAIVVGAVVLAARWAGLRGHALPALGLLAVGGFVLLARPEPSVVRASVMGAVVVLGLVTGRRGSGLAPLAVAVCVLVLADPWLARSIGFALSCAATAGIVVLARPWARAAAHWMPRPLAAALAVPLAAQLACTPLLVGLSGQLSLSALPANLLAAPAVPPATVLGVAAAAVGVAVPALAHLLAAVAMVPSGWIVLVAQACAALAGTVVEWTWGVPLAAAMSVGLIVVTPTVLRSPVASVAVCAALVVLLLRPVGGWPPPGWLMVACDVGQGDALVLRAGDGDAVVVDAGADPDAVDRCLDDLGVHRIPVLVISHFDADHSAGVSGVGRGRSVSEVLVTVLDEPPDQAARVVAWASEQGVRVTRAVHGRSDTHGQVTWQVIWPERIIRGIGSPTNQASIVLRATVGGVSVLLTGDIEPAAQRALSARSDLDVDVLKVPHHGSSDQDPAFLRATSPAVAIISVGRDNPYGQPGQPTLDLLDSLHAVVARTDTDGDVAVVHRAEDWEPGGGMDGTPRLLLVRRGAARSLRGMLSP